MQESDKILIDRFLSGNREAFGRMVTRWQNRALNLAYRLTGDFEEALDIRQRAFVRAFQGLPSFNGSARFSTWFYRIIVNLCRDSIRSRRSRERVQEEMMIRSASAPAPSPEHRTERKERAEIVAQAVAQLPPGEREVVVLRHYHERSFPEIAAIVGAPPSTVKSRMERGLSKLKERLRKMDL